ncbi:MAG: fibronectin type III domain-containing protein, partial [Thermoguttaceae bacterium]|nr:fibronectin type III domain-containing protein [Thermoguttaceae bacterium]
MKRSLPNKVKALRFESLENRELLSVNPLETSPDMIPQGVVLQASTDCAESEPAELIALGLDETPGAAQSARVPTSEILSEDFVIAPYAMEATQATPTVWVVDTTADTVTSDAMSLRKAIQSALGGDVIEFSPSLNGATISVTSPLSVTRSSLTIDASALSDGVTLDGGGQYRIMDVAASVNSLTITGVGFAHGYTSNESGYEWIPGGAAILFHGESLQLSDCSFTDNESHSYSTMRGGAIHVSSGILSAESCEFKNNKQIAELTCPYDGGGAIGGESASLISVYDCYFEDNTTNVRGGAIRSYGEVIVDSSVFIGNEASGDGGAIYCEDANLTVEGSAFLGNSAGSSGGAVESREGENKEGYLIIKDSFFIQNSADVAGGAIVSDSSLIESSQISGNTANLGAGIFLGMTYGNSGSASLINLTIVDNVAEYYGGAVYGVDVASTQIENSVIARNTAMLGSGLYLEGCETTIRNSTITRNSSLDRGGGIWLSDNSVLNAYNSIIAANTAPQGADMIQYSSQSAAWNVLSSYTSWNSGANRLAYNANQPLFTNATQGDYSLAANSQALNHGDNSHVTVQTDLAGKTRIIDGTVDLGAYEYSATSPTKLETPAIASTSATHNSIAVNWNATPNASGYVVAYRKFSDSSYTILPATSSTTLTIEELDAETTYYVKVYAAGDGTNYTDSSYSAVQSVRTREVPTEKLATPTIAATTATTNSVAVTWGAVENASGYVVAYKKSTDSDYTVLPSTTMTTRTIVNLNADTTYDVKVYAEGDGTNYADSDYSAVKSVKTLPIGSVETPSVTVTTDLDVVDAYDGKISLREALALYSSDGDTILFASSMKGKTITLAPENGQLDISKNITIDASNLYTSSTATPGVTISGGDATRIMQLASGKTTTLKGLAFTRGKSFGDGGAILNNGALNVQNCVFSDNDANVTHEDESIDWHSGGAIAVTTGASINADGCVFSGNNGSGVISIRTNASSTFKNCQIIDNPTYGVYFWYGSASQVNFENVVFTGNEHGVYFSSNNDSVVFSNCILSSNHYGLYLNSDNVTVSVSNCELSSNHYGAYAFSGSLSIDDSKISNNHVGIYSFRAKVNASNIVVDNNNNDGGWGGGIYLNGGEITLRNATITNNHAGYGGGIVVQVASAVLNVYNSIIAGNTASWNGNDVHKFNASSKVNAWNVLSSFTGWSSGSSQLTYDANQPLFTNAAGGDYSLATGSQAINRGNNSYATTQTDVVGRPRIIDGTVDLGAYEYGAVAPTKLGTPTITTTTATTNSTTIKWNAVTNASGYALAYKKSTDSVFTVVSTTSTSITINGLTPDTSYDVKVYAKGNGTTYTDSDYSAVKTVKTQPLPAQKLTTPTITTTTATTSSTTVKWNAVANAAGYALAYKKSTDSVFTIVSTTSTSVTINGLTADTTYDVKVCAKGNGTTYTDSDYSAVKTVKTQPLPAQKLTTPTITTTTSTENKIVVKWNAVENAAGYVVAYKKATDSSFTVMSATTANSRTITNLSADASYDVKVCAKGDGTLWTDSDYCAVLSVKTQPKTLAPLEAPAITSTTATDDTIVVNWSAVANASGYVVEYKLSTDPAFAAMPATSANSTTIANLTPETTYKLRVYAIGDGIDYSDSQYSIVKAVKTKTASATTLPA